MLANEVKLKIDGYKFRIFQNVLKYSLKSPYYCDVHIDQQFNSSNINYDEIYFIIDSPY